ncbi:hypothetical protein DFH06DRAFT_1418383 [Mycena polygramma]|nr:hypothetical protein DFH06DRAFT_1418383 [Mycena polygramma]
MDFNARGKCMKPDCRSGCMVFIPCEGPPPAHPGLVRCAVCPADPGCCVAQHADIASVPNPTPPMPPLRTQGGGAPSATFHTRHASRGFAAPAMGQSATNPFKGHADRRQQDMESKLNNPLNTSAGNPGSKKFYPAQKSQLDGDLNPHGSKSKKRKRSSKSKKEVPSDGEPDDKRRAAAPTKGSKPMATKCYSATLAENTKAVASKGYYKPSAAKLSEMNRQGLVKNLHLAKQPTATQIREAVYTAFSHIPELEIYGFRVLEVKVSQPKTRKGKDSKKSVSLLQPSTGVLGMEMWERALAQTTVRDAGPGYRNMIYIALNPAAPNLAYPGVDCTLDTPDRDLSSSDFSGNDDSDSSDDKEKKSEESDGEADDESHSPLFDGSENGDEDDAPMDEDEAMNNKDEDEETGPAVDENQDMGGDFEFESPETYSWNPFPAAHVRAVRLVKNIAKPDTPQKWWRPTVMTHLKDFNLIRPLITELIDSTVAGHLQIDVFFTKINKYIVKPLEFVNDLAICITDTGPGAPNPSALLREFEAMFGLGPGGINIVLPILSMLYEGLARLREQGLVPNYESHKVEYGLDETSKGLVTCLTYFRENYHRSLWDPKGGFRELAYILRKHDKQLPVGTREHPMHAHIDSINLRFDSIASLRQSLQDAFGSATDAGQMLQTVIVGGEYGLQRFYTVIVEPLLDKIDRDDYDEVVKLCIDSCRALGRKCGNYTKPGRGSKAAGSTPSAEDEGPRTRAQAQSRGASAPRNAKSGYFKTPREANDQFVYADELYTDTAEDMTRTESAREDSYTNLKVGPGIKTRRKRRHTTEQVPSSDSEDYRMPKPRKAPASSEYIEIDDLAASPSPEPTPEEQQHAHDLEEAEALLKLEWFALRKKILARFPHPNPEIRATLKGLNRETDTGQFKKLIFVYHPDRTYGQTEHWKVIANKVSAALNKARRQPKKKQ